MTVGSATIRVDETRPVFDMNLMIGIPGFP